MHFTSINQITLLFYRKKMREDGCSFAEQPSSRINIVCSVYKVDSIAINSNAFSASCNISVL